MSIKNIGLVALALVAFNTPARAAEIEVPPTTVQEITILDGAKSGTKGVPTGDRNGCQLVQRTTDGVVCLDL